MTIYVDRRQGSKKLAEHITPRSLVKLGIFDADVEFLGDGPDGPLCVGVEFKTVSDCLTSMTDGRLTGTQVARMLETYSRVYLLIEGPMRISQKDGLLEVPNRYGKWEPARGRRGEGWTAREYHGRLCSLEEFTGIRIAHTFGIRESAAWIVNLYHWWQKDYQSHSSYRAWDQSRDGRGSDPAQVLLPTSKLPLAIRWARELYNVGQEKAPYIASHFKTGFAMALADEHQWANVTFKERVKSGPKKGTWRERKMSKEMIAKILAEIQEGKEAK